jgi:hypothetical protein
MGPRASIAKLIPTWRQSGAALETSQAGRSARRVRRVGLVQTATERQRDSTTATTTPVRESPTKKSVPQTRSRNEAATPIICMHNRARLVQVASAVVGACCWTEHFTRATPPFLASVLHERKTTMPPLGYFAYHAAKHGRQIGTAVNSRKHCGRSPSKCLLWVSPRLRLPRSTIRSNSGFVSPANDTEHDAPKP